MWALGSLPAFAFSFTFSQQFAPYTIKRFIFKTSFIIKRLDPTHKLGSHKAWGSIFSASIWSCARPGLQAGPNLVRGKYEDWIVEKALH